MMRVVRTAPGGAPLLLWLALVPAAGGATPDTDAATLALLRTGQVIDNETVGTGVTHPQRLTLTDGERTIRALWKTVDEYAPIKDFHDGGPKVIGFRDSWKHEVAAYELDRLLGLGLVPPTVGRRVGGTPGAAQLWIEGAMTETERQRRELAAPDTEAWNRQIYTVRLFRQLTHDTDFNNTGNLLIGDGFRVWAIDHSRAFKTRKQLLAPEDLDRFPADALASLRRLRRTQLDAALEPWLTRKQRDALMARRDLIVQRADRLIAERGEAAVLLP